MYQTATVGEVTADEQSEGDVSSRAAAHQAKFTKAMGPKAAGCARRAAAGQFRDPPAPPPFHALTTRWSRRAWPSSKGAPRARPAKRRDEEDDDSQTVP